MGSFIQMADIDCGGATIAPLMAVGEEFPVGFFGSYDGQGHAISNFRVNGFQGFGGLFPLASGGQDGVCVIKNLSIENATIEVEALGDWCIAGGLIGSAWNLEVSGCRVKSCIVKAISIGSGVYYGFAGGLVGEIDEGSISQCLVEGCDVTGSKEFGGMLGSSINGTTIDQCAVSDIVLRNGVNRAIVHEDYFYSYCGGFAGQMDIQSVQNCYAKGVKAYTGNYGDGYYRAFGGFMPFTNESR